MVALDEAARQAVPEGDVASHSRAAASARPAAAWPLPARLVDHLVLDSRGATLAYWGAVALVAGAFFVTKLLPCVDYPQHLALSDVARRLGDPNAPEHAEYQLNYFTYNGLFHVVVAALSRVVPVELAGRVIVAASLLGMAGAVLALLHVLRRPPAYAALFLPILFSFSVGWGFVNYVLATTIAAWTLVFVARAAVRPTVVSVVAVAVLGLVCAFAHVLAMLILCLSAAALALEVGWRATPPSSSGLRKGLGSLLGAIAGAAPLLLGCLYCVEVFRRQFDWDPNMYRDPTIEGSAPPLVQKAVWFGAFATDLYRDATDQVLLWSAIAIMAWSAMMAFKQHRASDAPRGDTPPIVLPFVALLGAYFATPMVLVGTHLIFPRLSQWVIFGAVLATPLSLDTAKAARARLWMLRLGVLVGINTVLHCARFGAETIDASRLIDDLPEGQAATAVIWEPGTRAFRNGALTHLAAYYAARKHGRWAFAFARYLSVPVRYQPSSQPAWPARGWEFSPEDYDPRCKYARAFPLVLVKAPSELRRDAAGEESVRGLVFHKDAHAVRLLSHHGRYWAFDTTGLPDDGIF